MIVDTLPVQPGNLEWVQREDLAYTTSTPTAAGTILPSVIRFTCTPELLAVNPNISAVESSLNTFAAPYLPCIIYRYDPTIQLNTSGTYPKPANAADQDVIIFMKGLVPLGSGYTRGLYGSGFIVIGDFDAEVMIHETTHMLLAHCAGPYSGYPDLPYGSTDADVGRLAYYCPGTCSFADSAPHLAATPVTSQGRRMCQYLNATCYSPVSIYTGQNLRLETTVTNVGRITVPSYSVRFWLSERTAAVRTSVNIYPGLHTFQSVTVPVSVPLAPGQARLVETDFRIPSRTQLQFTEHGQLHDLVDQDVSFILAVEAIP